MHLITDWWKRRNRKTRHSGCLGCDQYLAGFNAGRSAWRSGGSVPTNPAWSRDYAMGVRDGWDTRAEFGAWLGEPAPTERREHE